MKKSLVVSLLLGLTSAHPLNAHPLLNLSTCTKADGCKAFKKRITLDHSWGCPPNTCNYDDVGIQSNDNDRELKLNLVNPNGVGSRSYMMENTGALPYTMFKLLNQEFTFDVDVSTLECGLNGTVYFVEMDKDGGAAAYPGKGNAALQGTGYCDAQCPKSNPYSEDGKYGSCCSELDIWESNKMAQALTPHPCTGKGNFQCSGEECGDTDRYGGVCDKDGCAFQPYGLNVHDFYGPGPNFKLDSSKKFTVVTQFHTTDGTENGDLAEIKRFYVQNGKVIENPQSNVDGMSQQYNYLSDDMCDAQKSAFHSTNDFKAKGGMKSMGGAFGRKGMVAVFSFWDSSGGMTWLDSGSAGTCKADDENGKDIEKAHPNAHITFGDIRIGEFGSTFSGDPGPTPPPPSKCPGGSLAACMGLCPGTDPTAFKKCVDDCVKECSSDEDNVKFLPIQ